MFHKHKQTFFLLSLCKRDINKRRCFTKMHGAVPRRLSKVHEWRADCLKKLHPEDFIPLVKAFSEKENKSEKVFLIIDNIYAPSCPEVVALHAADKNVQVMFSLQSVTALQSTLRYNVASWKWISLIYIIWVKLISRMTRLTIPSCKKLWVCATKFQNFGNLR